MKKIVLYEEKKDCCACSACLNVCPKQAICMQEDEYGFLYPVIYEDECVRCGLCIKTCGYQNSELKQSPQEIFIAQTLNTDIKKSASGGVFASLAKQVIEAGGIVVGVALEYDNEVLEPRYLLVDNLSELDKLLGSKYVQSSTDKIYMVVKEYLIKGKIVLFTGTPCQVDGLKSYLGKDFGNLFCIDIICHGVPSKRLFQDYIKYLESKYNDKIIDFKFRDKTNGWGLTANAYTANSGNKLIPCYMSSYYDMFLKSYTYRINCYSCKYANKHRVGDLTIGDYWGIEIEHPEILITNGGELDEKQGVSCLIVNNKHGSKFLDLFGTGLSLVYTEYDKVAKHNAQLNGPCKLNALKRDGVLKAYAKNKYDDVEKYYQSDIGLKGKFKNALRRVVPLKLKIFIKSIIYR